MIKIYYYGGYRLAYTVVGNRVYDEYGHEEYKIIGKYSNISAIILLLPHT